MIEDDDGRGLRVHVRSATKDSLAVAWRGAADLDQPSSTVVSGYKVRYQAVGSTVVQYSHLLRVSNSNITIIDSRTCIKHYT